MTNQTAPDIKSDPDAYDVVPCDQFGVGPDGKPIADNLTGTGSDAAVKEHDPDHPHKMTLTKEEQDILNGSKGPEMAKVLQTIVRHGELFGAERLADCGGRPRRHGVHGHLHPCLHGPQRHGGYRTWRDELW